MIEFWFDFASTYSYPAAMRLEAAAREHGRTVAWRPFLLGPIFQVQGWNDSPFNRYPAKGRYMWRDPCTTTVLDILIANGARNAHVAARTLRFLRSGGRRPSRATACCRRG